MLLSCFNSLIQVTNLLYQYDVSLLYIVVIISGLSLSKLSGASLGVNYQWASLRVLISGNLFRVVISGRLLE